MFFYIILKIKHFFFLRQNLLIFLSTKGCCTVSLDHICLLLPFWPPWFEILIALQRALSWEIKMKVKVAQSRPTLCNLMDYTVHGILQARILEWVAVPFSTESSQPRDQTGVFCIAGGFFTSWATRKTVSKDKNWLNILWN